MKKLMILFLSIIFLAASFPITAMAADWEALLHSPGLKPGDLIRAGATEYYRGEGSVSYHYDWDGADIDFREMRTFASKGIGTVQYDYFIWGDSVEFTGAPVITYDNGTVVYGEVDKYTDGEHASVVFDTSIDGIYAEIFAGLRGVRGGSATQTVFCTFSEYTYDGKASSRMSGHSAGYDLAACNNSPHDSTRTVTKSGSVLDLIELIELPSGDPDIAVYYASAKVWPIPAASGIVTPPPTTNPPTEQPSDWAKSTVERAGGLGLLPEAFRFGFRQPTTRAEYTAISVALYEHLRGEITGRSTFTDTTDINVEKAAYIGVLQGVGGNRANPDGALTREQAATMLARLADALGVPLPIAASTFVDRANVSPWAEVAVGQVQAAGIMTGVSGNRFAPREPYERQQVIATIMRMYDRYIEAENG